MGATEWNTSSKSQPWPPCVLCHLKPYPVAAGDLRFGVNVPALTSIKYKQVTELAAVKVGTWGGAVIATDVLVRAMGFLRPTPFQALPRPPVVPKTLESGVGLQRKTSDTQDRKETPGGVLNTRWESWHRALSGPV